MGKKDFNKLVAKIKDKLGLDQLSAHISAYSDPFDERENYAGCIIYAYDGQPNWKNNAGAAKGHRGQCFYLIILNTKNIPNGMQRSKRDGQVHYATILTVTGVDADEQDKFLCGGFAYQNGQLKFNSVWFNENSQTLVDGLGVSDRSNRLSADETDCCRVLF